MRIKMAASNLFHFQGRRLDCGPYMSGALEAKLLLGRLACRKDRLQTLTQGGMDGIINAGRIRRLWVDDPQYGVPFLSSSDILQADLSTLRLISHRVVHENPKLLIHKGWTLITRSGTIGRMTYCRSDMDGMACSEDVLRVIPDKEKILPGYLSAYLSSKFGLPQVISSTYGAIIQHLEPHHLADLPVPRLGEAIERQVHELVEKVAGNRSEAARLRLQAQTLFSEFFELADLSKSATATNFSVNIVSSRKLQRLDAAHYSPTCIQAEAVLSSVCNQKKALVDIASVFTPGIFKRIHVNDPEYGYAYFSGSELFELAPKPRGYLSRKAPNISDYIVHKDWLLIQDAGQLGGLIGRITRATSEIDTGVVSNHLIRVVPQNRIDAAYVFTVLSSPHGYRSITHWAFGSSIPQLDPTHISKIVIPWPDEYIREAIAQPVVMSWNLEDEATWVEKQSVSLVEQTIEGAT